MNKCKFVCKKLIAKNQKMQVARLHTARDALLPCTNQLDVA